MRKLLTIFLLFAFCGFLNSATHAQENTEKYRIGYDDGLFTISAKKANLEEILRGIADDAGILLKFPDNLKRLITIKLSRVPLTKALHRLLSHENYVFVYEGNNISVVYVLKASSRTISKHFSGSRQRQNRIRASIERYEKRLKILKDRMTRVNASSHRGKAIIRQIGSTEKTIERLRKRLE